MTELRDREPQMGDQVKNKNNDYTGVVNAKYTLTDIQPAQMQKRLDVRLDDSHIAYNTPAYYWEVVQAVEDIE